jgi:2-hydroxy-3-keto-5-methylthiopentenyl-1-phosphate phosphatase
VWAVLCDFDGTIMKDDVAELILRRFAKTGWERFNDLLATGKITVEDCVSEQYAMIRASSAEEVVDYASRLNRLRPGFKEFLRHSRRHNVAFVVVSAGIDFCIRDAFRIKGIEMPQLVSPASTLIPMRGLRLVFPKRRFSKSRDFKEDTVMDFKARGHRVVYVGDGSGDANAAERSDAVFAVRGSMLQKACGERRTPHRAIQTFEPLSTFISWAGAE